MKKVSVEEKMPVVSWYSLWSCVKAVSWPHRVPLIYLLSSSFREPSPLLKVWLHRCTRKLYFYRCDIDAILLSILNIYLPIILNHVFQLIRNTFCYYDLWIKTFVFFGHHMRFDQFKRSNMINRPKEQLASKL